MKIRHIQLSAEELKAIQQLKNDSEFYSKVWKKSTALLEVHRKNNLTEAAETAGLSLSAVKALVARYKEDGIKCLHSTRHQGRQAHLDEVKKLAIINMVESQKPKGHKRWTLRLIAQTAMQIGIFTNISHTSVASILEEFDIDIIGECAEYA